MLDTNTKHYPVSLQNIITQIRSKNVDVPSDITFNDVANYIGEITVDDFLPPLGENGAAANEIWVGKKAYNDQGQAITGTLTLADLTSDADATAADIAAGSTAYVDGTLVTGEAVIAPPIYLEFEYNGVDVETVSYFGVEEIFTGIIPQPGAIKYMNIDDTIVTIGESAFNSCLSLETITIDKHSDSVLGSPWGAPVTTDILWKSYDVIFDTLDVGAVMPDSQIVLRGSLATQPEDPTPLEGRVFVGWATDDTTYAGNEFDFTTATITADIIVYAIFENEEV